MAEEEERVAVDGYRFDSIGMSRLVGRSTANEPLYSTLVVIISISIIVLCYCP